MKRTKEDAAETKRQILKAAEHLFLEHGYEDVTLDEIASASGVSRGAVHFHFVNKAGLLHALRDDAQLPLQQLADGLECNATADPLVLLGETISTIFYDLHSDDRRRGLIRLMIHLDLTDNKAGIRAQGFYKAVERIFIEVNRHHKLAPPWTPKSAASAVSAVVVGTLEEWALARSEFPLVPYGQDLVRMVLRGFADPRA
ncbi:TetR family transcriptional regulator [Agrobacterium tumefaciens]|uniref:TetR family transcriptional regulator n=1 Tax=Agrobacterium tumefaciens TaxID=358 RepID=A0AA44J924_AGRTU|nr:TetR family transcriptional regulator [Agrobacterium tumefaciens]NSL21201.1 TetR family transcriptional regulator [Agrobacterium tumefaciens]NTB83773.1 TetR family transcriptional regulator [Agrobacterium tumefaciens]NTC20758.1 TetR family transcriptional regulator [Agrobacterium tumefaciens]NTC29244.1 TetR family transcriptional regulator [Agrobacterium tumefaciens]NTC57524.1 TetR family transcriptional regulator [Agrobacterium tumefaciens]